MAYFRCMVGGSGDNIKLIVNCSSSFAGLTITCTDGITTLTQICPSSSPYEVVFSIPNTGTWTVSGTISGTTFSESILIQDYDVTLQSSIDLSVDFYSAANDTVSYTGIDGNTHTITTDNTGHATAIITVISSGSSLTFTSSVAKDPANLSNYYSKTILINSSTTSVYCMPDKTAYWWGYSSALSNYPPNSSGQINTNPTVTDNTNSRTLSISCNASGTYVCNYLSDFKDLTDCTKLKALVSQTSLNRYSQSSLVAGVYRTSDDAVSQNAATISYSQAINTLTLFEGTISLSSARIGLLLQVVSVGTVSATFNAIWAE